MIGTMSRERVTLHRYRGEVVAEVVVDHGTGDVRTASASFDVLDPETGTLSARGDLPGEYAEAIRQAVADSEFSLPEQGRPRTA